MAAEWMPGGGQAEGVQVQGDVDAAVAKLAGSMPSQYLSTAQDLARGKRSEIDYLNGLISCGAARRGAGDCDAGESGVVGVGEVDGGEAGLGPILNWVTVENAFANCPRGCSVPKAAE